MLLCYPKPKNHWYYWFFAVTFVVTFAVTFFENVTFLNFSNVTRCIRMLPQFCHSTAVDHTAFQPSQALNTPSPA